MATDDIIRKLDQLEKDIATLMVNEGFGTAGGALSGAGTAGRITEWATSSTLQSSTLIKSGAGLLTLSAGADYTLTVPATGTAVVGSGAAGQLGYWSAANTLTGSATAKISVGAQATTLTLDHEFAYLKLYASAYDSNSSSIYFARNGIAGENIAGIRLSQISGPASQPQLDIGIVQLGITGSTLSFSTYNDTLGNVPGVVWTPTDVRLHVSGIQTGNLAKLAVGGGIWASGQIQSTVATGTAPFVIASTTVNTNLNADLLDGQHASDFAAAGSYVPTARTITEGAGLAGNTYDLSANRTLAMGTPSTLTVSTTNSASGTTHSHAITSSSNPGAAAAVLASNASGYLRLVRLGLGVDPTAALSFVAGTTAAAGIDFGGDVNLYRASTTTLQSDNYIRAVRFGSGRAPQTTFDAIADTSITLQAVVHSATLTTDGNFIFTKSHGTTATPAALLNNDVIGSFQFKGYYDATNVTTSKAKIYALANEAWSSTNQGTKISFAATPNASTTLTDIAVIYGDGLVVNEGGNAGIDTRFESDTEPNMLWLDASADALYLGGATNYTKIDKAGLITTRGRRDAVTTKTANYTATSNDEVIVANKATAITITLPAATGSGQHYHIASIGAGACTIQAAGAETIWGSNTQTLYQYESIDIWDYAAGVWTP